MYETFEHTADFGIRIRAENLDRLFAEAGLGLFNLILANLQDVRPVQKLAFQLQADNVEELFHDWLAELLYTFHAKRLVLANFQVHLVGTTLHATARGEPIDPRRHEIEVEVKAITWHGLKVEQNAEGWLAEVIVDV